MRVAINPVMYVKVDKYGILDDFENMLGGSASGDAQLMTSTDQLSDYEPADFRHPNEYIKLCELVKHYKFDGDIILYC